MRALVTGGAGFIGSHLVDALVAEGADVVVLDDLSSGFEENVNPQAEFLHGDVADPDAVYQAVTGCEVVFHLAAHRSVLRSVEHPLQSDRANVAGTLAVLLAARDAGVRRVIAASSSMVYGEAGTLPTPEHAQLAPRSPYAVSKLAAEHYGRVFWELFGLETVALRYFNVYGPRQRPDSPYAAAVPLFVDALLAGRAPEVHGDGRQSRDLTFVADAVATTLRAAEVPREHCAGKAYNVAGGRPYTVLELLEALQALLRTSLEPVHTAPRPGDVRHTWADISAAEKDLLHRPGVPLAEGLERTVTSAQWSAGRGRSLLSK